MSDYPDPSALLKLQTLPAMTRDQCLEVLEEARTMWVVEHGCYCVEADSYHFNTGGWSGNEEIIDALQRNAMFWARCWEMSKRGGEHVFRLPEEE